MIALAHQSRGAACHPSLGGFGRERPYTVEVSANPGSFLSTHNART